MEAWSNLKKVNGDIGQIQSRLSTGKRINSAEDDTSGYALSKHLESRARGLSQALDNVGTAKNVLNIAEGGYQAQMTILQTIKEKMTQAADGSFSDAQRGAIGDQVEALLEEYNDINTDTKFNDNVMFGESITFQVGEGNGDTLQVSFSASNRNNAGEDGIDIDDIVVRTETGADTEIVSAAAADQTVTLSNYDSSDGNAAITVLVNGTAISEAAAGSAGWSVDTTTGVVTIDGASITDAADTYSVSLDYTGTFSDFTQAEAQSGITTLDSAIKSLAKSIQNVGDSNARLSSKEESLSLGISNTEATRSRIEDADFAKEQMSMMKLQILQQTSVSSFSQANSAPQMVLSLFR
jgi:flagellin